MKYISKSAIDAIQWNGNNYDEVCNFVGMVLERDAHQLFDGQPACLILNNKSGIFKNVVYLMDFIIKDDDLFYIMKPHLFNKYYKKMEE